MNSKSSSTAEGHAKWWLNTTASKATKRSSKDTPTWVLASWGGKNRWSAGEPHFPPRVFYSGGASGKSSAKLDYIDVEKQKDLDEACRLTFEQETSLFPPNAAKPSSADWEAYLGKGFEAMGHPPTKDEKIFQVSHRPVHGFKHAILGRPLYYKDDGDNMTFSELCEVLSEKLNFNRDRGSNLVSIRSDKILPSGKHLLMDVWPSWIDEKGYQDLSTAMHQAPSWDEVTAKYQGASSGSTQSAPHLTGVDDQSANVLSSSVQALVDDGRDDNTAVGEGGLDGRER